MALRKLLLAGFTLLGALVVLSAILTLVSFLVSLAYGLTWLLVTLLVPLVVLLTATTGAAWYLRRRWRSDRSRRRREPKSEPEPVPEPEPEARLDRLQEAYVRGEIDEAMFERRVDKLLSGESNVDVSTVFDGSADVEPPETDRSGGVDRAERFDRSVR